MAALPVTQLEIKRRKKGLSQWDLARMTGIVQSRLSLIERGMVTAKKPEIESIAKGLGLSIEEAQALISGERN